jgi:acetyl-CoA C-acetyltransferase
MAARGIADRVAIVGMSCTEFGEHWDRSTDDLLIEAVQEAITGVAIAVDDVDAFWLGTYQSGISGLTLSRPLRLSGKPVSRVENMCATGSEALRSACYAVASGAYDVAMAVGVEKLKDSGFSGLSRQPIPGDGTGGTLGSTTGPANFSLLGPAYAKKYGLDADELKRVITRIAWKNHRNGARNPRAQFRKEVPADTIARSPLVAGQLGIFDCSGVSDGAAAAIVVRAQDAHRYTDSPLYVKALSLVAGDASGNVDPSYDFTSFPEVVASARQAYAEAGVRDPRAELALAEVHDCFTVTELVLMEDLGFAEPGTAWKAVLAGTFDLEGDLPVNPDGGLKAFGHPVGASGLRMLFECWLQLRGEAPESRRIATVGAGKKLGLTHNLGGGPGECVSFVSIVGSEPRA